MKLITICGTRIEDIESSNIYALTTNVSQRIKSYIHQMGMYGLLSTHLDIHLTGKEHEAFKGYGNYDELSYWIQEQLHPHSVTLKFSTLYKYDRPLWDYQKILGVRVSLIERIQKSDDYAQMRLYADLTRQYKQKMPLGTPVRITYTKNEDDTYNLPLVRDVLNDRLEDYAKYMRGFGYTVTYGNYNTHGEFDLTVVKNA